MSPVASGELRVLNQFTERLTVNEIADRIRLAGRGLGLNVAIDHMDNPRKELEEHYYNPQHRGLLELGLKPHPMTDEILASMLEQIRLHEHLIDRSRIMPRVRWR
jgi:UDP-sulfoquinovose synthase